MGMCSCRPVNMSMLTPAEKTYNEHVKIRSDPWKNGRRWNDLMNNVFYYIMPMTGCVQITWEALASVLLGNFGSCFSCGCYFDITQTSLTKYTFYGTGIPKLSVATFSKIMNLATLQKTCSGMEWGTWKIFKVFIWPPNSPELNPIKHGMCWTNNSEPWRPHFKS